MNLLKHTIKWDSILIFKYGIVAVAVAISSIYCVSLLLSKAEGIENIVVVLIFSDPVMYGFLFTAVMILFERDSMTNQALAVTPLTTRNYVASKCIVFTGLAFICSVAIVLSSNPEIFHPTMFLFAVVLSSVLFVLLGIVGVSFTKNFTQFILVIPLVFLPTTLPFLDYFNLVNSWVFYAIPTQACLVLFKGAISNIETWKLVYAIAYLAVWIYLGYKWAIKSYNKRILKTDRNE